MEFQQDDKTKSFIASVDELIDQGVMKDYADVVQKLGWFKSSMSAVINGKMNVPARIARNWERIRTEGLQSSRAQDMVNNMLHLEAKITVALGMLSELKSQLGGKSLAIITAEIEQDVRNVEQILKQQISASLPPQNATQALDNKNFKVKHIGGLSGDKHLKPYKNIKAHTPKGKKWYVEYHYLVPEELRAVYGNSVWKRFKVYEDINRIKTKEYAKKLCDAVDYALQQGYNPFEFELQAHQDVAQGVVQNKMRLTIN